VIDNPRLSGFAGVLPNLQQPPTFAEVTGNPVTAAEISHLSHAKTSRSLAGFGSIKTHEFVSSAHSY